MVGSWMVRWIGCSINIPNRGECRYPSDHPVLMQVKAAFGGQE
jgi:hypothetical protein